MAQATEVTQQQIATNLRAVWAEIDTLPETSRDWATYSDEDRFEFDLEWPDLLGRFRMLGRCYAAHQMTAEQQEQYERLVHRYEVVLPIIEQLGLQTIPVPKLRSHR